MSEAEREELERLREENRRLRMEGERKPSEAAERPHESFARLFAQNHRRIYGYVRALVPGRADAEEVFQERCVVLWREFPTFDHDRDFSAWPLAIAFNQVRSYRHRVRANRIVYSEALLETLHEERVILEEQDIRADALAGCLKRLSGSDREIIRLYYSDTQRTIGQVAERLRIPTMQRHYCYWSMDTVIGQPESCRSPFVGQHSKITSFFWGRRRIRP